MKKKQIKDFVKLSLREANYVHGGVDVCQVHTWGVRNIWNYFVCMTPGQSCIITALDTVADEGGGTDGSGLKPYQKPS